MTTRRTRQAPEQYPLSPAWLYREDLKSIADAVGELGKLEIECISGPDTYEATEASDFDSLPEKLDEVSIKNILTEEDRPAVKVSLGGEYSTVGVTNSSTHSDGVLGRILGICHQRKRTIWRFSRKSGLPVALLSLVGVIIFSAIASANYKHHPVWNGLFLNWIAPIFLLSLIPAGIAMRMVARGPEMIITNEWRANRPTYWQRTGDMWIVGVITAILGAVIGYLLGKFSLRAFRAAGWRGGSARRGRTPGAPDWAARRHALAGRP